MFTYICDRVSAGEACEAAVNKRTKCRFVVCMECGNF